MHGAFAYHPCPIEKLQVIQRRTINKRSFFNKVNCTYQYNSGVNVKNVFIFWKNLADNCKKGLIFIVSGIYDKKNGGKRVVLKHL